MSQCVVTAVAAAKAQEAVGQDPAFQQGIELVFDELRRSAPAAFSAE